MATLNPKKNKSNIITVRFSDEEKAKILVLQQKHGYRSTSSLFRALLFDKRLRSDRRKESAGQDAKEKCLAEVIFHLKKLGANYNQIVRKYHKLEKDYESNPNRYLGTIKFSAIQKTFTSLQKVTLYVLDELNFLKNELKEI